MKKNRLRAEITVSGLVQGVGFRFFVFTKATKLKLYGFTRNQIDGTVKTIVEGEKQKITKLYNYIKIGPTHAQVKKANIYWSSFIGEFSIFEIRRY